MKNTHVTGAISSVPTAEREDDIAADCAHERRLRILHAPPNTAPDQREGSPHQGDVSTGTREGTCWASVSCNVNVEATAKPRFSYACLWNYLLLHDVRVTFRTSHQSRKCEICLTGLILPDPDHIYAYSCFGLFMRQR